MSGPAFQILGPIVVTDGGREVRIGAPRLRTLLGALLVRANHTVTPADLVEWIWGAEPPGHPQRALHTAVFRLRGALGKRLGGLIRTTPGGYQIDIESDQLDLSRFRAKVDAAAGAAPAYAAAALDGALGLWRGEPLTGTLDQPAVRDQRAVLVEEWLRATEQWLGARLDLGEHAALVAELTALTRQHPLREKFWAQLMLALHRSERLADALAAYRELAALLSDELGVDPGEDIQRLHLALLRGEPPAVGGAPTPQPTGDTGTADEWQPHRQLPLDIGDFVGRQDLADSIAARLLDDATVPVVTITGPPGVGKSALAVRVAHRLRTNFPDGQWFVPLNAGRGQSRDPDDVLGDLLGLCGADRSTLPIGLDARSARLRSLLADRKVLIVLDDAQNAQQVRPLLPGTAGSAVLVTSRTELSSLAVLDGAHSAALAVLEENDAVALLGLALGARRIDQEPEATAELARLCGYLPLAVRIAAGHVAERLDQSIAEYAADLRTGDRLSKLAIGDEPETAVRAAFARSYAALRPAAQRLFGLLGMVPGPDVTAPVAAALLDQPVAPAGRLLDALVTANLLQRHGTRYRMHDLIRLYAEDRATAEPEAGQAWHRVCDWYLRSADAAVQFEYLPQIRFTERQPEENRTDHHNAQTAAAWLEAELDNLVAAIARAAGTGPQRFAWQLADVLRQYFLFTHRLVAWRQAAVSGLVAARADQDRGGEGAMLHSLGALHFVAGDNVAAIEALRTATDCYAEAGFRHGVAALLCNLGMAYDDQGDSTQAAELLLRGVRELRALDEVEALAQALNSLSNVHCNLGELDAAMAAADEAVRIAPRGRVRTLALFNRGAAHRLAGDLANAETDLAQALQAADQTVPLHYEAAWLYLDLGRLDDAASTARRAVLLSRQHGLTWHEGAGMNALGAVSRARGDSTGARRQHETALDLAQRHGHRSTAAEALLGLATVAHDRTEETRARAHALRVLDLARELRHRILECRTLLLLAAIETSAGNTGEAARYTATATTLRSETGYHPHPVRNEITRMAGRAGAE